MTIDVLEIFVRMSGPRTEKDANEHEYNNSQTSESIWSKVTGAEQAAPSISETFGNEEFELGSGCIVSIKNWLVTSRANMT